MSPLEKARARHNATRNKPEMIKNSLRYETLRRLKPFELKEFLEWNLGGERFDNLVDQLVADYETRVFK